MHAVCGSTSGTAALVVVVAYAYYYTTHDMSFPTLRSFNVLRVCCVVWMHAQSRFVSRVLVTAPAPPTAIPAVQKSEKGNRYESRRWRVARARHLHAGQNRQWLTLSDYLDGRLDLRSITSAGTFTKVSIRAAVDARSTDPRVSTTSILSSPKYGAQLMRMQVFFF